MSICIAIPTNKRFKDLTGKKFNRLTVIGYLGRRSHSSAWMCQCDCGAIVEVSAGTRRSISRYRRCTRMEGVGANAGPLHRSK
jgi:hypothetical protein